MYLLRKCYLLFFIFLFFSASSQSKIEHQNIVWYGYFLTYPINTNWYAQGEAHERHFLDPILHHQSAFRSHIHRTFGEKWDISAGAALFLNTPNDPFASNRLSIPEYRPHVDIVYKQRASIFSLDHRFRAEMRFNRGTDAAKTHLIDAVNFSNYRFRYRIQALFPLFKKVQGKINTEILLNAAQENPENVLDQHRMFAGISIPIRSNLTVDMGYLHAFQQRPNLDYYDRSIISLMIYHRLK